MEKKLGAAVVAVKEGVRHIRAYRDCPDYNLLALCDPDREKLESRIKECNLTNMRAQRLYQICRLLDHLRIC